MIGPMAEAVPPLGLARYGALFRVPHVRRLVLSGMLARLPAGMIGLALLLLVRESGSYAAAGAVSGEVLRRHGHRRTDRGSARRPARAGADPPLAGGDLPGAAHRSLCWRCSMRRWRSSGLPRRPQGR